VGWEAGTGRGPAVPYVPLALVLLLAFPLLAFPLLADDGLDFAMYAPIRNAMPTTNETMARIW
jgi:hypothetical protein